MKKFVNFTLSDLTKKTISPFTITSCQPTAPKPGVSRLLEKPILPEPKQKFCYKKKTIQRLSSQNKDFLQIKTSLLCTMSGGQDSILIFFLLLHTRETFQVLYCQHLWQIKNFFSARLLYQLSYLVDVPYTLILPQNLVITENESREWRKKNFSRFSRMQHILVNLTGHTETDTLEKNLNNLLRGTSPAGFESVGFLNLENFVDLLFSTTNGNGCFFSKLEKKRKKSRQNFYQNYKTNTKYQVKQSTGRIFKQIDPHSPIFKFFSAKKILSKNQTNQFYKQRKSCSFCFSTKFFKMRLNLIKPLKKTSRFNVSKLVNLYKLPILIDITNFSSVFSRNKIRHHLIPFLRSLIHPNVEISFSKFFKLIAEQNKDNQKDFKNFYFLYKIVNLQFITRTIHFGLLPSRNINFQVFVKPQKKLIWNSDLTKMILSENWYELHNYLSKELLKIVSVFQVRCLIQKLFFEYKNLNLTSLQSYKLQNFYFHLKQN